MLVTPSLDANTNVSSSWRVVMFFGQSANRRGFGRLIYLVTDSLMGGASHVNTELGAKESALIAFWEELEFFFVCRQLARLSTYAPLGRERSEEEVIITIF
ncbi:hypothetical protein AVEN_98646-1 [Araneus ventricosus]|uniref:Uncharacterized protein n=1 Tax=Araneus ventricosus TaxID=182803 RepID=A0A4Y2U7R2_ARAVE|nr:hypothetical protein AVEN_160712-1 [Araneus ventricosus]GBO08121.1 hypothetical protein AVEN_98646-1 [Araneus ventricosus]